MSIHLLKSIHKRVPVEARVMPPLKEIESLLRDERGNMDAGSRLHLEGAIARLYQFIAWRRTQAMAKAGEFKEGGSPE